MNKRFFILSSINLKVFVFGLVLTILGAGLTSIYSTKFAVPETVTVSIGTSILATAIASEVISRHYTGVDVSKIVNALFDGSPFIRENHRLSLVFRRLPTGDVRVEGKHSFSLRNPQSLRRTKRFSMYTDLASWNNSGGFSAVTEPGGHTLRGNELANFLFKDNNKVYFKKAYLLNPEEYLAFTFFTFGIFRSSDRLIWTVQDLSTDFAVEIRNEIGTEGCLNIKFNHHKEANVIDSLRTVTLAEGFENIEFSFGSDVLPHQGFEISWNLQDEVGELA